ncbi:MAG: phytanoyl-CoA dioxygenase family protein [Pseudomonadota bacterium]
MTTETKTVLSAEHIEDFKRDGYVVVRGLYSADEVAEMVSWTEDLAASPEVVGLDWKYFEKSAADQSRILSRIENFVPFHDGYGRLITQKRMAEAVSELFGEEAVLFKDKINFKLPGGDGFKAHQDVQAGWNTYAPLHITAMVALDATTAENGSLEFLAGYHDKGLLGDMWKPLEDAHTDDKPYAALHCAPGDAVFFDSFAPHKSAPNTTSEARRVLYITYNKRSDGDHRAQYYADKHANYPPDIEREAGRDYGYKV